jgi:hypothetical protein
MSGPLSIYERKIDFPAHNGGLGETALPNIMYGLVSY